MDDKNVKVENTESKEHFNSKEPIYFHVYREIKKKIDARDNNFNEFLPSERELCEIFDVSRSTIRRALNELDDIGYIKRHPGKRSQIINEYNPLQWTNLLDFSRDMIHREKKLTSIIIEAKYTYPNDEIRELLKVSKEQKIFVLKRIRVVEGIKISYNISYLIDDSLDIYSNKLFGEHTSLKKIWQSNNIHPRFVDETLQAVIPDNEIIDYLDLDHKTAVMRRERLTYDIDMKIIEYVVQNFNANYAMYYLKKGDVI